MTVATKHPIDVNLHGPHWARLGLEVQQQYDQCIRDKQEGLAAVFEWGWRTFIQRRGNEGDELC